MTNGVYLGLGSNLGDREANLAEALERIKALGLEIKSESSLYETEPVGYTNQPCFLNQVIETTVVDVPTWQNDAVPADPETTATVQAEALLSELLKIELDMGRDRLVAEGPRVIDVDLLLFGNKIISHSIDDPARPFAGGTDIFVPHPRMHLRRFVLEPLCEIAPAIVHPVLKKTCREILALLDDESWVRLYKLRD